MPPPRLTAAYVFSRGERLHLARLRITGRTPCRLHSQDFGEVFWVESGTGIHLINGQQHPLTTGTLVLVRPNDCHEIRAAQGTAELVIADVIFPPQTVDFLRARYFPTTTTYFWASTPLPFTAQLTAAEVEGLTALLALANHNWVDQLATDRFLLELLNVCRIKSQPVTTGPPWLQHALEAVRQPQHFNGGPAAFARLAGHCSRHVNRVLHQYCGQTITAVINQARLEYAAQELAMSDKKILEICFDCGFKNPSYFYRVFQRRYKTTPHQYRQRQRAPVRPD
ncbi:MAG: HTH-type transcriptional regulator ChbR [Verrucomicrobiae bacterium]|nr:HTH-type transcriptional regulator ChbR [Verrucomicrobiae bacterium]